MSKLKVFCIGVFLVLSKFLGISQENVVKLKPLSLSYGNIGLSYERVVAKKRSLVLNAGFLIPRKFPSMVASQMDYGKDTKLSGFSIVPEYRFYTSNNRRKNAPRGFYFAPYLLVSNYSAEFKEKYDGYDVNVDCGIFTLGAGAQIGIQWLIADRVSIDWTFLGLGLYRYAAYGEVSSNAPGVDFELMKADIDEEAHKASIIGKKLKTEAGSNYLKAKAPILFAGIRSSFTIGIAF